jgi:hypothetical protein
MRTNGFECVPLIPQSMLQRIEIPLQEREDVPLLGIHPYKSFP